MGPLSYASSTTILFYRALVSRLGVDLLRGAKIRATREIECNLAALAKITASEMLMRRSGIDYVSLHLLTEENPRQRYHLVGTIDGGSPLSGQPVRA